MVDEKKVDEPVKEEHPIIMLLGSGITSVMTYLQEKFPKEDFDFQVILDSLFDGIGKATQETGIGLFVLSQEDQKFLGMIHQIKRQYGPGAKLQIKVTPKNESGLVNSGGVPIDSKNPDKPLIIKP